MRPIDADTLNSIKFHLLPYTHITPSDADSESYKRGWNDAIDAIIQCHPTLDVVSKEDYDKMKDLAEQYKFEYELVLDALKEINKHMYDVVQRAVINKSNIDIYYSCSLVEVEEEEDVD